MITVLPSRLASAVVRQRYAPRIPADALIGLLRKMAKHSELDPNPAPMWLYADIAAAAADELERLMVPAAPRTLRARDFIDAVGRQLRGGKSCR